MDIDELKESGLRYKPIFDRAFFRLLSDKMGWEDPDSLYDEGLTGAHLCQVVLALRKKQEDVKATVEWRAFSDSKEVTLSFCSMRTDELLSLFYVGDNRKDSVRLYMLNRLARFVSSKIRKTIDVGASLVSTEALHLFGVRSYDQLSREIGSRNLSLTEVAPAREPEVRPHGGSGIMPSGSASINEAACRPGDKVSVTYFKSNKMKCVELVKDRDGAWRIVRDTSTTHADPNAAWRFLHLAEGERLTLEKVGSDEVYTYDRVERVRLDKSETTLRAGARLDGIAAEDYLTNLHAGRFFILAFGDFIDRRYRLSLATLADFRSLQMQLRETEIRVQELAGKYGKLLPFQPGEFCEMDNEELRNLFGYNGLAYFENGVRFYAPKQHSEKPVKINLFKLNKLARFMTLESAYPDRTRLEASLLAGKRPYKDYVDLEKAYADSILSQGIYQTHGGGSGIDLKRTGLLSHMVPIGTTVVFSYVQGYDKDQNPVSNKVSLYYNGDCCWKVVSLGKNRSNIDVNRVWRTAAIFNGEPLRLVTLEGDMEYCFGYLGGGVRIERGSNRGRMGARNIKGNILKAAGKMGSSAISSSRKP